MRIGRAVRGAIANILYIAFIVALGFILGTMLDIMIKGN